MPDGALVGSNFMYSMPCRNNSNGPSKISDDVLWMVKYAELVNPNIASMIWGRPCGADRWQISSSGTNCITEFSESTVTIDIGLSMTGPNYITPGTVSICGTGERDGIYKATAVGSNTVTVGDCLVSASSFPFPLYNNCGTGFIGNCKWPQSPGICGQKSIVGVTIDNSGSATIAISEPTWLITGDGIYVQNAKGVTGLNGYHTLVMVDSNHFILNGSHASGSYQGSGTIKCPFTPDQKWFIPDPNPMVMNKQWKYNFRDVGEHYRLETAYPYEVDQTQCGTWPTPPCVPTPIPPNPRTDQCGIDQNVVSMSCDTVLLNSDFCAQPTAVYYSPNVENFGSASKNLGFFFPGMDSQYGSMWQSIPQQTIDDPMAPYQPCLCQRDYDAETDTFYGYNCGVCSFSEDNGTCQTDQTGDPELGIPCRYYYAAHDVFKARCKVPEGSPQLPPNAKIGCATTPPADCTGNVCWAPYAPSDFPDGDTCFPYLVYVYENPWALYQTKEGCVCYQGRFGDIYARNGVVCNSDEYPPP
jgi:hypothetical protein